MGPAQGVSVLAPVGDTKPRLQLNERLADRAKGLRSRMPPWAGDVAVVLGRCVPRVEVVPGVVEGRERTSS